ncbi:MAG TPA: CrcB family protein [Microbacteriaceae bacterium]|nr:CrcB family protein [Microbacteriaceae bacterium]
MPLPKRDLLLVFIGGALGTLLRFFIGQLISSSGDFPLATFVVNISGSFAIGFLLARLGALSEGAAVSVKQRNWKLFLGTGFLGGFTTYSAFAFEIAALGPVVPGVSLLYAALTIVLGVVAALVGIWVAGNSSRRRNT